MPSLVANDVVIVMSSLDVGAVVPLYVYVAASLLLLVTLPAVSVALFLRPVIVQPSVVAA